MCGVYEQVVVPELPASMKTYIRLSLIHVLLFSLAACIQCNPIHTSKAKQAAGSIQTGKTCIRQIAGGYFTLWYNVYSCVSVLVQSIHDRELPFPFSPSEFLLSYKRP